MLQPLCESCGQPATIHQPEIENGTAVARHFCHEHGDAAWRANLPAWNTEAQDAALQEWEEYWRSLPESEKGQPALLYRLTRRGQRAEPEA
jgi:hypothetical protein